MKNKSHQITVDGIPIEVTKKKVKHLRIVVYPTKRKVRISSPFSIRNGEIRRFAEAKLEWIKKHFARSIAQKRTDETFRAGTNHKLWGNSYPLHVIEEEAAPKVLFDEQGGITLYMRPGSTRGKREKVIREWYRRILKNEIPKLIYKWEPVMNVSVRDWGVKKMKTRWGTCNIRAGRIWLNLELAKKTPDCLEYIVVHEMNHLHERLHSPRFYRLMDQFMPEWQKVDQKLNGVD